jgi:hypothetical protein
MPRTRSPLGRAHRCATPLPLRTLLLLSVGTLVSAEVAASPTTARPPAGATSPATAKPRATKVSPRAPAPKTPASTATPKAPRSGSTRPIAPSAKSKVSPPVKPSAGATSVDEEAHKQRAKDLPNIKMLRPHKTNMPRDVKQGAYEAYAPRFSTSAPHALLPHGSLDGLPVTLVQKTSVATARNAHRNPAWDANGEQIVTCAEYAYEQVYDIARFVDAAAACRGDADCVFQIAYLRETPGIARRVLNRKDNTPMKDQFKLPKRTAPKNEVFAVARGMATTRGGQLSLERLRGMLYANGGSHEVLGPIAPIPALEAAIMAGFDYYRIGTCTSCDGKKNFKSVWDWHETLRNRTRGVSAAEFDEYERRRERLRELWGLWRGAVSHEEARINAMAPAVVLELPWDQVTLGFMDRIRYMDQSRAGHLSAERAFTKAFGNMKNKTHLSVPQLMKQGSLSSPASAAGVLAMPMPVAAARPRIPPPTGATAKTAPKANARARSRSIRSTRTDATKDVLAGFMPGDVLGRLHGCSQARGPETYFAGPISCQIGVLMREEWARHVDKQDSCLDLSNPGCDWRPQMFEDEMLAQVPMLDTQIFHEADCQPWLPKAGFNPPAADLTNAEERIEASRKAITDAERKLGPFRSGETPEGRRYKGKVSQPAGYIGDPDWFRASLGLDTGWDIGAKQKQGQEVCQLEGGFSAKTDFKVQILGSNPRSVVSANLDFEVNKHQTDKVRFKRTLKVVNQTVYQDGDWVAGALVGQAPTSTKQIPSPALRVTIPVGPYQVTLSGWGDFLGGLQASASGTAPNGCDPNATSFRANARVAPFFLVSGVGQASVGVPGVSVGIRAWVNLLTLQFPAEAGLRLERGPFAEEADVNKIVFDSKLGMLIGTLSGRMYAVLEVIGFTETIELFRWRGLGPAEVNLVPRLETELPLHRMSAAHAGH